MSLTVSNSLAQQQAIQSQIAAAQSAAVSSASSSDGTASTGPAAAASPAAALISGNATLTSDLLSVLLNDQATNGQSGSQPSAGGAATLADMLNAQDQASQGQQGSSGQLSLPTELDTASLSQSAHSTGSVMGSLQSLLTRLTV